MTIQTQITLDLVNRQAPLVVHAKQYDNNTRQIAALLTENGAAFDIPDGTTAIFQMAKPDGTYVFYDSDEAGDPAVVIDGSIVTVTLVAAALQVAGECQAQIDLYNAGDKLTSFTFIIAVQPSTVPDDAISETYVNVLTELIGEAQAAAQQAEAAISTTAANAAAAAASASAAAASAQEAADAVEQIESELSGYVPNTRTVNGKALSSDITLDAADVGARDATWTPTASEVGARADDWLPTPAEIGAVSSPAISGTISTSGAGGYATISAQRCYKQGNFVVLYVALTAKKDIPNGTTIAYLPAGFMPKQITYLVGATGGTAFQMYSISSGGSLTVRGGTIPNAVTMQLSAAYYVDA